MIGVNFRHPLADPNACDWLSFRLIVDNDWVDDKFRQRVLHRLGRLDHLLACDPLSSLVQ
jgi:hypothetical protein